MLTEQRYEIILKLLEEKNSITVAEVKDLLNTSESTVRRDITALHNAGKLVKVFGGAVACDRTVITHEPTVEQKAEVNVEAKQLVAAKAAALIQPEDFVYLDAGTTTASMLSYLTEKSATFVTNAVAHAKTTPDMNEAMVKKTAIGQCRECFILADHSKFGNVSSVTFGAFQSGTILTDDCPEEYKSSGNVVICG